MRPGETRLFLALVFCFSAPFYAYVLLADSPRWTDLQSAPFMWCPAAAAIATRLILRRDLRGLGLGWGKSRGFLLGVFALPFLLAFLVYLTTWVSGLGAFSQERFAVAMARFGLEGAWGTIVIVPAIVLLAPVGVILGSLTTLGEELGWRGLLVPRFLEVTTFTKASLLTGFIWSAWHYPLVVALMPLHRPGFPVWYALLCFTASVVGVSFFYTWMRIRSGSIWPAVLLHSSCNSAQQLFEGLTVNTGSTHYVTFEYGAGFVVAIWLLVAVLWRRMQADGMRPAPLSAWLPPVPGSV